MTKRYRLLKDVPGVQAGFIFTLNKGEEAFLTPHGRIAFDRKIMAANPNWFQPLHDEEPEQDMSIFEVGNIVRAIGYPDVKIVAGLVGSHFWAKEPLYGEGVILHVEHDGPWTLISKAEPKPEIKPKAPAYCWDTNKSNYLITAEKSAGYYSSQEEAVKENKLWQNVQWPATIDPKTGMYPGPK